MNLNYKSVIPIIIVLLLVACTSSSETPVESPAPSIEEISISTDTVTPTIPTETPILPTNTPLPITETPRTQDTEETQEGEGAELVLQVQGMEGVPAAEGGVFMPPGGEISFDAIGRPDSGVAGFWRSLDDSKFTVLFRDQDGNIFSLVELQGIVRWDEESNLTEGKESFLRIQIESGQWLIINEQNIEDNQLSLTDENGDTYLVIGYSPLFEGIMVRK